MRAIHETRVRAKLGQRVYIVHAVGCADEAGADGVATNAATACAAGDQRCFSSKKTRRA